MLLEESQVAAPDNDGSQVIEQDNADETVSINEKNVSSYGIDYDIRGYVGRLQSGDIKIPEYQRKYVWDQKRASRFIESLLLELPVPGVYLYRDSKSEEQLVVDGNQRLQSLRGFYEGKFVGTDRSFKLTGLESRYNGLSYKELDIADRRRLDNSFIRATVIRQVKPDEDATSQYFIFERLNTGGVALTSQEIRAAIYGGSFNRLLNELNCNEAWRTLYGKKAEDKRKRDEELILRFIALYFDGENYRSPMKGFLNKFMQSNQYLKLFTENQISQVFENTVSCILQRIGDDAFKPTKSLNAAMLDSIMIGIASRYATAPIDADIRNEFKALRDDEEYIGLISDTTSAPERVRRRIEMAISAFANAG